MPVFASRKPKVWAARRPPCAPGVLWSLGGRKRNLQDTCELLPPRETPTTTVGSLRMGEVCWGSHVPCSCRQPGNTMSFTNCWKWSCYLPVPVSKALWRLSMRVGQRTCLPCTLILVKSVRQHHFPEIYYDSQSVCKLFASQIVPNHHHCYSAGNYVLFTGALSSQLLI